MEDTRRIVIKNIKPYDGEYPLDDRAFNTREWNYIKRISGYMPFTIEDGFKGGDPAVYVAVAVIAMVRAGKVGREDAFQVADELFEAPFELATIQLLAPHEEADERPLELTSEPAPSSQSRPLENPPSSGAPSSATTGPSEKTPVSTGTSESDTSPTWGRSRLVS